MTSFSTIQTKCRCSVFSINSYLHWSEHLPTGHIELTKASSDTDVDGCIEHRADLHQLVPGGLRIHRHTKAHLDKNICVMFFESIHAGFKKSSKDTHTAEYA